jgi:hypothetical protein
MNKTAFAVAIAALSALIPRGARADIPIANANGWSLSLDGRLDTFFSFANGDGLPNGVPNYEGVYDFSSASNTITKTRIRSGFLTNILGFTLKKELSSDTVVTGRFGTWVGVAQQAIKADVPAFDERELYIKIDAPWGGLLAGRNLSLFGRGSILLDYDVVHGYGLGSPCAVQIAQGGSCGFAGYGILFPGYNAGIVYNTPVFGGFQISGGAFDPSGLDTAQYQRTPLPRVEGEATFEVPKIFKASASGQWQKIGQNAAPYLLVDSSGVSFSAGVDLGPVQLGGAGFFGQGLGIYQALENTPIFSDQQGVLRHQQGYMGVASLTLGGTKLAGGVGVTQIKKTVNDSPDGGTAPLTSQTTPFPQQQLGISVGIYQKIKDIFVVALEYFRSDIKWQTEQDPANNMNVITPKQDVDFVNGGITMVF